MSLRPGLGATYRLQLRPGFGFADSAAVVPYLARLGVETVYLSPIAEAVPGSEHGYDGTDPASLRAELGGESAYAGLVSACEAHGLGICVDHVPNHLATWHRGPWWRRLLAEGPESEMAEVFDVDWEAGPPAAHGKVALPILDRPLTDALADGLVRTEVRGGEPVIVVGPPGDAAVDLPVAPGSAEGDFGEPAVGAERHAPDAPRRVDGVLGAQHYRLVDFHDARDRNYRRFFDIDGLVGVRVERESVFDRTHALLIRLAERGWLSAIRVDHVDGLREPANYLHRLREVTGVPVVVEKILAGDEPLRTDWPVVGTTGYETMDDLGGVLVDPHGLDRLVEAGRGDGDQQVARLTVECRRLVATTSFPGEVARAAQRLGVRADGLREVAIRLPRYRTYLDELGNPDATATAVAADGAGETDGAGEIAVWRAAQDAASRDEETGAPRVLDAMVDPENRDAVLRLQQLTGALMAKGVEDTAWYRLAGLLAFCEVGADPGRSRHDAVSRWHARAAVRVASGVHGLVPGTTHDTKRAQDVRCRLYALSEMAHDFGRGLWAFRTAVAGAGAADDLAFETRVAAQLALGVVPPLGTSQGAADGTAARETSGPSRRPAGDARAPFEAVADRLGAALVKGAREGKRRSSWTSPDVAYEGDLEELARCVFRLGGELLEQSFGPVVGETMRLGAANSLSATVLRHALPGIPDCFQGDEAWNLSLVDPDNRRPVDFATLAAQLDELDAALASGIDAADLAADLRRSWRDGRVKQYLTAACLRARAGSGGAALAPAASYLPLSAAGPAAGSVLCFARTTDPDPLAHGSDEAPGERREEDGRDDTRAAWAVVIVTRLPGRLDASGDDLPFGASYARTTVPLPDGAPASFLDVFTGSVTREGGALRLDEVLASLPVALLVAGPSGALP